MIRIAQNIGKTTGNSQSLISPGKAPRTIEKREGVLPMLATIYDDT